MLLIHRDLDRRRGAPRREPLHVFLVRRRAGHPGPRGGSTPLRTRCRHRSGRFRCRTRPFRARGVVELRLGFLPRRGYAVRAWRFGLGLCSCRRTGAAQHKGKERPTEQCGQRTTVPSQGQSMGQGRKRAADPAHLVSNWV
ncbi:hypothetical protein FM113_15420 [Leucobacter sp. 7(1)]|nr:hypothetical protein FM113_15420 [Leucobacter sp. 7(1)]